MAATATVAAAAAATGATGLTLAELGAGCCYALCGTFLCCVVGNQLVQAFQNADCPNQFQILKILWKTVRENERVNQNRASIATKTVNPGDVFMIPAPGYHDTDINTVFEFMFLHVDHLYGVTDEQLLRIVPKKHLEDASGSDDEDRPDYALFKLIHKTEVPRTLSRNVKPTMTVPLVKNVAVTLALRMAGRYFPFRSHRCNSKHYTDYLTYGQTFGTYATLGYWPVSRSCPVWTELDDETDTNSPDFKLTDYYGKAYELNEPLKRKPVPEGVIANVRVAIEGACANIAKQTKKVGEILYCKITNKPLPTRTASGREVEGTTCPGGVCPQSGLKTTHQAPAPAGPRRPAGHQDRRRRSKASSTKTSLIHGLRGALSVVSTALGPGGPRHGAGASNRPPKLEHSRRKSLDSTG